MSHQVGRKTCLQKEVHPKLHLKRKRGKAERWRRSSARCERVQALTGEKRAKMLLGDSDRERSYTTREALHSQESKVEKAFQGHLKRQHEVFKGPLKTNYLKASETNKTHAFKALHKHVRLVKPRAQARTQIRALCPPESTQAHTLTRALA